VSQNGGRSHTQILKPAALIGGAAAVRIPFVSVPNKVAAVLLGPAGLEMTSLYSAIIDLALSLAGAAHSGYVSRTGRTAAALRASDEKSDPIGSAPPQCRDRLEAAADAST
jgi:hypothetical protein